MTGILSPADVLGIANQTDTTRGATEIGFAQAGTTVAGYLAETTQVVSSVASIRVLPRTGVPYIRTLGYYGSGTKGSGTYYLNSSDITSGAVYTGSLTAVAPPVTPTLTSVAGGTLTATTYWVKITYVTANGETLPSMEASLAVAANFLLVVNSPMAQTGVTGYNVYVSTTTGTEIKQNTTPIVIGTNWTEPVTGLAAGMAVAPTMSTAGSVLNITSMISGALAVGLTVNLSTTGVTAGYVVSDISGTGGIGTYLVNTDVTYASQILTSDNGGTYIVAADGGRWDLQHTSIISVKDFGAKGDGVTDDTAAIQAALNIGGLVFAPSSSYLVSQTLNFAVHGTTLLGSGYGETGTVFLTNSPTNDVLKVPQGIHSCHITQIRFQTQVPRTGGWYVNFSDGFNLLENFYMDSPMHGVLFAASNNTVARGYIENVVASTGTGIDVAYGSGLVIDDIVTTNSLSSQPLAAVNVTYCFDLTIANCDFYGSGYDLYVHPSGGQYVGSIKAVNTFFDTAVRGLFVQPTTNGGLVRCTFDNCWFGSHSEECVVLDATNGPISGVLFSNPVMGNNASGFDGLGLVGPVNDIQIHGGQFAQIGGAAISLSPTCTNVKVDGAFFGAVGLASANVYNVYVNAGASNYVFANNTFGSATTTSVVGHLPTATEIFKDNLGFYTESRGAATFPTGATSLTVNHNLSVTPPKEAIMLSPVSNTAGVSFWVGATTSTTFTIDSSSAPAGNVYFGWRAATVN